MGSRTPGILGTAMVHLILILLVLLLRHPVTTPEPAVPTLLAFDVRAEPPPPPPPTPPPPLKTLPPPKPTRPKPSSDTGSPRPSRAPIAAISSVALPRLADVTIMPDAPIAPLAGLAEQIAVGQASDRPASGRGSGGRGTGTGSGNGDGGAGVGPLRGAVWIDRPSEETLRRSWPTSARAKGLSGLVRLACIVPRPGRPRRCTLVSETPDGEGFGDAALALWPDFRIRPVMRERAVMDLPVFVTLAFDFVKPSAPDTPAAKR